MRAANLAAHLPDGSAVFIAQGSDRAWTAAEHLLALAGDILRVANWQRAGSPGSAPSPTQRPSDKRRAEERTERLRREALAYRDRHRNKRG